MGNGPAMPPILAVVQTPVLGSCGVSKAPVGLVVKGQEVKRQVTDVGVSPERKERMLPEAKKKETHKRK